MKTLLGKNRRLFCLWPFIFVLKISYLDYKMLIAIFSPSADKHIYNFGVIFKLILKKSYNSKKYLLQIGYYPMGLILCKSNYSPFLIKLSFFSS